MKNWTDKAIAQATIATVVVGVVLTPMFGIWHWAALSGALWMTGKSKETVEQMLKAQSK